MAEESTPNPDMQQEPMPEVEEGQDWSKGVWAGLDQWTCLMKMQHPGSEGKYSVICNQTFFSFDDLMAHIRDDH